MNNLLRTVLSIYRKPLGTSRRSIFFSNINRAAEGRIGYGSERYEPTTIAALDTDNKRLPLITGLYDDGFLIAGQDRIIGPIFTFPRQVICWNVKSPEQITPESLCLLEVIQPKPEIFVLGFGARKNKILPETIKYLRSLKIGFEILPTTQACETYNFLLSDNRLVYAGFYPQDDLTDQSYGMRTAIARSQLYEKDEGYIRTELLEDANKEFLQRNQAKKTLFNRSPLFVKSGSDQSDDESQVQSLTGTSAQEKRTNTSSKTQKNGYPESNK